MFATGNNPNQTQPVGVNLPLTYYLQDMMAARYAATNTDTLKRVAA
jgi:hypothetical protein